MYAYKPIACIALEIWKGTTIHFKVTSCALCKLCCVIYMVFKGNQDWASVFVHGLVFSHKKMFHVRNETSFVSSRMPVVYAHYSLRIGSATIVSVWRSVFTE